MSQPARSLRDPAQPVWHPTPDRALERRPAPRPRRGAVGFLVLVAAVVGSMVLGLVTLNALLAQTSFRVDDLQTRIEALSQENLQLTHEQAALSAPGRVAAWARAHGMRLPDDIRFLHVSSVGPATPAGGADNLARIERRLKQILGAGE